MTQDERLVPARAGRELDRSLADLTQSKGYGGRYGGSPSELNLKEYLFVVFKRKWLIMSIVLIVSTLATIQAYREPSVYQGATTIRIEQKTPSILQSGNGGGIVIGQSDPNFWGTQLRLLQNQRLARQVVLRLDLQHSPAFFGPQGQSTIFASLKRILSRDAAPRSSSAPTTERPKADAVDEDELTPEQRTALEPYEDAINASEVVEPLPQTNLVVIRYNHTDPVLAQKIADTLADVFVENNQRIVDTGTDKATQELGREIAKYQGHVHEKEQAVFAYAKQYQLPLTETPGANLTQQRVQTYSSQLLEAENQKRNLQAAYDGAKSASDPFSIPEVQKDERIVKLREKITELKDKETGLLQKYTREWPDVQQIEAQIAQLEGELKKAPAEVIASMKSRADAAANQVNGLKSAYTKESGLTAEQTKNIIELASKRADLASDQQYLNTLFQKRRELTAVSGETGTKVSVENHSRLGILVGPFRMKTILVAFVLSLLAGVGLAFLLDFLDDTIKTVDDVDRYINLPALALIPAMRDDKRLRGAGGATPVDSNGATALAMVKDVRSPIAESYRHLRTSLLLSSAGKAPRTILVTSSQPSEGKTTTAINTAFMLAQTGVKVLIIDCDLRRPRLHAHFNISNAQGLTNCLSGNASDVDSVIQDCPLQPNLKLLTSGPMPPNPAELLGSEEMRKLLVSLSEKFTHVIVDSPPAISFTDASILSTFVDGVILVVHGGRSSRAVVRRAKQQLLDIGAHIFGVVLNNVQIDKTHDYYYGGYSSYYKSSYYTADEEGEPEEGGA
jgi:capsular exopolysaccharide synthesis family protein